MWTIYVLLSLVSGKLYVGMTQDLKRRITEHNSGKCKFTSGHVPWVLVYTEPADESLKARAREKYLKSAAGKIFIWRCISGSLPD